MKGNDNLIFTVAVLAAMFITVFCGCEKNDGLNNEYCNPEKTTIYTKGIYNRATVRNPVEDISSLASTQKVSGQNVTLRFDDAQDGNIVVEFAPDMTSVANVETQLWSPSIISLNKHFSVSLPYTTFNDMELRFSGDIDSGYLNCHISGLLKKTDTGKDWLDNSSSLEINLSREVLADSYGWSDTKYWQECLNQYGYGFIASPYFMRSVESMDDKLECGGLWCDFDIADDNTIADLGINANQLCNLVFNLDYLENNEYQIIKTRTDNKTNLNALLGGTFAFYPTGDLVTGKNYYNMPEPDLDGHVWDTSGIKLLFEPSTFKYEPLSETEFKLFILPGQFYHPSGFDWGVSNFYGYKRLAENILTSLSSDLQEGIHFHKSNIKELPDGNKEFKLLTSEAIGRKVVLSLLTVLEGEGNKTRFLDAACGAVSFLNREKLRIAIEKLPTLIQNSQNVQFGVQLYKVRDVYNPF